MRSAPSTDSGQAPRVSKDLQSCSPAILKSCTLCPYTLGVNRRTRYLLAGIIASVSFLPVASASAAPLTYRYRHYLFTVDPAKHPEWQTPEERWFYQGQEISAPAALRVDGDAVPPPPPGFEQRPVAGYNLGAIRRTLEEIVSAPLRRPAGSVTIGKDAGGKITFDGVGLTGREVDLDATTTLTTEALRQGVTEIFVPVVETQPRIVVSDPSLAAQGIKEVVTIGESDMSNSPKNRRHNIATGLSKFNGTLIPANSVFSFLAVLGPVNGATGYLKELVIKGDRTVPDYGGGLCQVSSTAYRGIWEYGFPIVARQNHSYVVSHYAPVGTDATVFTPAPDMKFKNDSPGALIIQTYAEGDNVYFIYYGTRDDRHAEVIGPYIWDRRSPPPDRIEYVASLPPGQKKKVGDRVPGMKAMWYRIVRKGDQPESVEPYYSAYQARPLFYQIGVEAAPTPEDAATAGLESGDVGQ